MRNLDIKEAVNFIKEKCAEMDITAYKINKSTGVSALGIQNILDGKTKKPRTETVDTILSYLENYVLGSQLNEVHEHYLSPLKTKNKGVPYYNVDFTSGFDMLFNSEEYKADFFIDYKPYNKADLWVNNIGNSMSPVIENGDLLALQIKTDIQQIIYGEIYAIVMPEMRTIKYLRKSKVEGHVQFVPENLEDYDAQDMPIELIEKFFIVLGSIKKFF
jgi:phage repressor protein C with HTH and peptisase S24 domain